MTFAIVFIAVVVVASTFVLAFSFGKNKKRMKEIQWLKTNGEKVQAVIYNIRQETGRGGYNCLVVECTWTNPETKTAYNLFSDRVFDATVFNVKNGDVVSAYINPNDPRICFVDLTSIFAKATLKDGNWWNT